MKVCLEEEEDLEATEMKLGCGHVEELIEEAQDKLKLIEKIIGSLMDCVADMDDLLDEDDFKLEKLRCESSSQLTDSLDGDDNHDECNDSEATGPKHAVTTCLEKSSTYPCSEDKASNLDTSMMKTQRLHPRRLCSA
ncbi:Probable NADH dehydrogenase [ubiquinone] 1 alpha subcomplex subunit 5, mitochondrial, partial [Linum grandiflorum]